MMFLIEISECDDDVVLIERLECDDDNVADRKVKVLMMILLIERSKC